MKNVRLKPMKIIQNAALERCWTGWRPLICGTQ